MNAIMRLGALFFALVASATIGACGRSGIPEEVPNFRVVLSHRPEWRVQAFGSDTVHGTPLQTRRWIGYGFESYGADLFERPHKVIVEALHTGLGGVECSRLNYRVQVRLNDDRRSWRSVKSEAAAVPGDRNRCVLTLSWPRE